MSAEILRKAAALMRERASESLASLPDTVPAWHSVAALMGEGKTQGDAEHIASWDPTVALAVADLLLGAADLDESIRANGARGFSPDHYAVVVARAYLREAA